MPPPPPPPSSSSSSQISEVTEPVQRIEADEILDAPHRHQHRHQSHHQQNNAFFEQAFHASVSPLGWKWGWLWLIIKSFFFLEIQPPTHLAQQGWLGWLQRHPVIWWLLRGVGGLVTFGLHLALCVVVWQQQGFWAAFFTLLFMGYAELYWIYHFFGLQPMQIGWGLVATWIVFWSVLFIPWLKAKRQGGK